MMERYFDVSLRTSNVVKGGSLVQILPFILLIMFPQDIQYVIFVLVIMIVVF